MNRKAAMKLRARLLFICLCALLVPVLVAIAVAAAVVVRSGGQSREARFRAALELVREDIADTERRYGLAIARLAASSAVQRKLYVYNRYWNYLGKDILDGDIAVLRDDLENYLLSESLDTIAVYRVEAENYVPVVVVGNSTYVQNSIPLTKPSGRPEYLQTTDGIYATFTMPVFHSDSGGLIGFLALQKAFNRSYLEALSRKFNISIALYAQGLYRYSSLPGIASAGALWARHHPATGGLFSGSYPFQGRIYRYVGYYFEMGRSAKGYLFAGGPSSTFADWWRTFTRLSIVPLICVALATLLFILWGSEVIRAIRSLLAASVQVGRGEYRVQLPVRRRDEFGSLFRGFCNMARKLEENAAKLEESKRLLVTSERMAALGSFSAGVAHEINNPLGVILNHVQLLQSGKLSEAERGEFLARVDTEIKRISRLLRNLLHHATEDELSFSDFPPEPVVREVVQLFAPKLQGKGVAVELESFPAGLAIEGHPDAVKQVFFNLLYNAVQAIHHDHGLIRVRGEADGAGFWIRVSDNGEGMDAATRAHVFEPFFTRKQHAGTGLGLALSQKIMRQHGGSIEVQSEENVGTTVSLWFPLKESPCPSEATSPS
jgi:signal transduction histidine kinase